MQPKEIPRFLAGPCNHIYHCTYPVQEFHDGHAHFEGDIRGHDELYHVKGGGTYSPTTMQHESVTGARPLAHPADRRCRGLRRTPSFLDDGLPGRREAGQAVGAQAQKNAGRA